MAAEPHSYDVDLSMIEYGGGPAVLLIADTEAGRERTDRAAARAGCRVMDRIDVAGAAERLDLQVALDAVLADVAEEGGVALDRLLDRLDGAARDGHYGSVISAPLSLVDIVAARTPHTGVQQLCDGSEAEWAMAASLATATQPVSLHDVGKNQPPRLQQLSLEVGRIATILASLSEEEESDAQAGEAGAERNIEAGQVRAMIRARRLRDHYFKGDLFADPAWDMLLDLMAARLENRRVAVSSLCIAAAVPPTTALRWIKVLSDQGLFVRVADEQDGRRVFIQLSDATAAALEAYLRAALRISPLVL